MALAPRSHQQLIAELEAMAGGAGSVHEVMAQIAAGLARLPGYDWVGFYMLDETRTLVLGPYVGAPTPHTRIPLDQGICGAAASSGHTVVVDDVNSDPRYLACSLETKSEIVAPVFARGDVVGELDIDSHVPAAFGPDDRRLVEQCAAMVGRYLERTLTPEGARVPPQRERA
jgi:L-methionine (R)-S-oxide reductase